MSQDASLSDTDDSLAQFRFWSLLEETVLPPSHSVELDTSAESAYANRLGAHQSNVAETYHVNSKLTPASPIGVRVNEDGLAEARTRLRSTSYRVREEDIEPELAHLVRVPHEQLPASVQPVLWSAATPGPVADRLYALDLMVLVDGAVHRQPVEANYLWREHQLNDAQQNLFASSILRLPADLVRAHEAAIVVVGVPWRYMLFYGPRGYRRMLTDLGVLLDGVRRIADDQNIRCASTLDFFDARLDRLLLIDGVERSALAVILVGGDDT